MTLPELRSRIEGLTGPDREVNAAIHRTFIPEWEVNYALPAYTGSIDDALALVKRALPTANCVGFDLTPNAVQAYVSRNCVPRDDKDVWLYEGAHKNSIPAAILLALLSASEAHK